MREEKEIKMLTDILGLYKTYGIKSVNMEETARNLGISKKTLYQYFSDKDAVVRSVMDYYYELKEQEFFAFMKNAETAIDELILFHQFVRTLHLEYDQSMNYDLEKFHPDVYLKLTESRIALVFNFMKNNLKRGKSEKLYRKDIDEDIIAKLQVSRVESLSNFHIITKEEIASDGFCDEVMRYHLHGIVNETGLAYYKKQYLPEN